MRNVRAVLGQPPWDVLFPGTATGSLLFAHSISLIPEHELQQPRVAVVDRAEGDEDIPHAIKGETWKGDEWFKPIFNHFHLKSLTENPPH